MTFGHGTSLLLVIQVVDTSLAQLLNKIGVSSSHVQNALDDVIFHHDRGRFHWFPNELLGFHLRQATDLVVQSDVKYDVSESGRHIFQRVLASKNKGYRRLMLHFGTQVRKYLWIKFLALYPFVELFKLVPHDR